MPKPLAVLAGQALACIDDPLFIEKLTDVVGLYLDPPEHALVLHLIVDNYATHSVT
jgi:hypothetical protein